MRPAVAWLVAAGLVSGCSVLGVRTTPSSDYVDVERLGGLEIRRYSAGLVVEADGKSGDERDMRTATLRLAAYLAGANDSHRPVAAIAPLEERPAAGSWRLRVPIAPGNLATAPRPDDAELHLVALPPRTVGVYRYATAPGPGPTDEAARELVRLLEGSGWAPTAPVTAWFYDPAWTIGALRRNEVAVPVERPPAVAPQALAAAD